MVIIQFDNDKNKGGQTRPANGTSKILNGDLKYTWKNSLPVSASTGTLIFTADTNELFKGNGNGKELSPLDSIVFGNTAADFPTVGLKSKVYIDRMTSNMYYYDNGYVGIGTGEGLNIESIQDARIGNLDELLVNHPTVVAAINDLVLELSLAQEGIDEAKDKVNALELEIGATDLIVTQSAQDIVSLQSRADNLDAVMASVLADTNTTNVKVQELDSIVGAVELEANEAKRDAAVAVATATDVQANLNNARLERIDVIEDKIGDMSELLTNEKTSLSRALNEVYTLFTAVNGPEINVEVIDAHLDALDLQVQALNEAIEGLGQGVTQAEVDAAIAGIQIPSIEGLATTAYVDQKVAAIQLPEADLTAYAKTADVRLKTAKIGELDLDEATALKLNAERGMTKAQADAEYQPKGTYVEVDDLQWYPQRSEVRLKNELVDEEDLAADIVTKLNEPKVTEAQVDAKIAAIIHPVTDVSGLATKQEVNDRFAGLVVITQEEKDKYDGYEAILQSLSGGQPESLAEILERLDILESLFISDPEEGEPGEEEPGEEEPGEEQDYIWAYDFHLRLGTANTVLGGEDNDPFPYGQLPNTEDFYEHSMGELGSRQYEVWYLGPKGGTDTYNELVPMDGIDEWTSPNQINGPYTYNEGRIEFITGSLTPNRFRLIKRFENPIG